MALIFESAAGWHGALEELTRSPDAHGRVSELTEK